VTADTTDNSVRVVEDENRMGDDHSITLGFDVRAVLGDMDTRADSSSQGVEEDTAMVVIGNEEADETKECQWLELRDSIMTTKLLPQSDSELVTLISL